jgi:hypothetical protein
MWASIGAMAAVCAALVFWDSLGRVHLSWEKCNKMWILSWTLMLSHVYNACDA